MRTSTLERDGIAITMRKNYNGAVADQAVLQRTLVSFHPDVEHLLALAEADFESLPMDKRQTFYSTLAQISDFCSLITFCVRVQGVDAEGDFADKPTPKQLFILYRHYYNDDTELWRPLTRLPGDDTAPPPNVSDELVKLNRPLTGTTQMPADRLEADPGPNSKPADATLKTSTAKSYGGGPGRMSTRRKSSPPNSNG